MSASCSTMSLNVSKAGMEGLDNDKINKIIEEASKGSKFFQHKAKCQKRIDQKIAELTSKKNGITTDQLATAAKKMDQLISNFESSRDLSRTIIHIDMDAFYAAVEMRDAPELRDRPMAVGGEGMLTTSNYLARRFGVRAGMPGFIGRKLCPDLVIVPCNFAKYTAVSKVVQGVFSQYDPNFCMMSLDEGYLDITGYLEKLESSSGQEPCVEDVVNELRRKVYEATDLTCSAGIACNTRLAKIGSDQKKPNGQFRIPADRDAIMTFIRNLPIRKISGIGNVTEQLLNSVGVVTCNDLFEKRGLLCLLFSEISCHSFIEIALGLGCTDLKDYGAAERKSISTETTFRATSKLDEIEQILEGLCEELSEEMKLKFLRGKQFTLKCKMDTFDTITRQMSLGDYTNEANIMLKAAKTLLMKEVTKSEKTFSVRLIGVRMSEFYSGEDSKKQESIEKYLQHKSLEKSSECPVCFEIITFRNVTEFSNHVEQCLEVSACQTEEGAKSDVENNVFEDRNSIQKQPEVPLVLNKETTKKESGHNTSDSGDRRKRKAVTILDMFKKQKMQNILTCPVCNTWSVEESKVGELNEHIDTCLSNGP